MKIGAAFAEPVSGSAPQEERGDRSTLCEDYLVGPLCFTGCALGGEILVIY
jgi:hypothetical protein